MSSLSLYLEKKIINILLNEINKFNKTIPSFSEKAETRIQKSLEISQLLKSLSLVNWSWFNSVSSLLNSIENFHHSSPNTQDLFNFIINKDFSASTNSGNNKFKLIKNENIKYLRIDLGDIKLESRTSEENNQLLNVINNSVSSLNNLKKLVVSNGIEFNDIYFINKINFGYIKIGFLFFNQESENGDYTEPLLSNNVKEIVDIEGSDIDVARAVSILKPLKKVEGLILDRFNVSKFKQIYIQLYLDGDESKLDNHDSSICSEKKECCLSYVESLTIDDNQIQTCESLYYVLKLVPRVKFLSFQICFDNLLRQLDSSEIKCKGCMCSDIDECNKQFDYYWRGIAEMIQNHKYLSTLSIGQHCIYPIAYSKPFKLHDEFITKFGTTLGMNKSIKYLKTSKLPSNIINLIEFISNINSSIVYHKHYFLNMSGPLPNEYVLDYNALLEKYKHIKMFLIDDAFTNEEVLTYIVNNN